MKRRSAHFLKALSQAVSEKNALFPTKLSLQGTEGKSDLEQDMPLSEATTLSSDHLRPRVPNSCEEDINTTTTK